MKLESATFSRLRTQYNISFKFLENHLWDSKSKAHAAFVDFLGWLQLSKELEEFGLLFFFNSNTWIFNNGDEFRVLIVDFDFDVSLESKLHSIPYQIE